jgi:glycosyltransferase involved in cell wall biosynthesis
MARDRLKVGLLTPSLAGVTAAGSGIGVHFRHLADGLVEAGHDVTVLLLSDRDVSAALPTDVRLISSPVPTSARLAGAFNWQFHQWLCERARKQAAARAAQQLSVLDIWETTSTGTPALHFLRVTPRAPVVTRVSTTASQLRDTNAGRAFWITRQHERQERAAIKLSDAVVTHTQSHRERIVREFSLDPTKVPVIPHGIPLPPRPKRPARQQVELLYVGRLELRKGIDLLWQVLPGLLAENPNVHVTLVGHDPDGHWQARFRTEAPASVQPQIEFAGVVSDEILGTHYAKADVLLAPSRYESFGLMFVEAMAWELPVIALDTPGASEVLVHDATALLVPMEDIGGLNAAITSLIKDPTLRRRLGEAGRKRAEQLYSREALAAASSSFYRKTLGAARGGNLVR